MTVNERPEPAPFEGRAARDRYDAVLGRAWRLVGPVHRRAFRVWNACGGDVYLLNPMGSAQKLIFRILPEAITIAMDEADVPKHMRAETRAVVKMLHGLDEGSSSVASACLGSGSGEEPVESWREVCPRGSFNCGCRSWFGLEPEAAS